MENAPASKISFDLDPRTKDTLKWSAIMYAVVRGIENIFSQFSVYFMGGAIGELSRMFGVNVADYFSFNSLIRELIWGAVYGAIIGFVLSKFYTQIKGINQRYFKGKLNTFFKLLFYPSLIGSLLALLLLGGTISFITGFMPIIVSIAGSVLASYIYAKVMDKKVGSQYGATV